MSLHALIEAQRAALHKGGVLDVPEYRTGDYALGLDVSSSGTIVYIVVNRIHGAIEYVSAGLPDALAHDWAVVNWTQFEEYKADWDTYGLAAGPLRNQRMLDEGKPDVVLAFPGGKGTADMVARARKAGVRVVEVPK